MYSNQRPEMLLLEFVSAIITMKTLIHPEWVYKEHK